MIRSGFSPAIVSMFGCERVPTDFHGWISLRTGSITRETWLSSATPTGEMPTLARASTNENSSATMRVGVLSSVSSPWSSFTVTAWAAEARPREERVRAVMPASRVRRVRDMEDSGKR